MELLKQSVELLPDTNSDKKKIHNESLAFIEYSVVVHCIFIARQLNKHARLVITPENRKRNSISRKIILSLNIDDEIKRMKKDKILMIGKNGVNTER